MRDEPETQTHFGCLVMAFLCLVLFYVSAFLLRHILDLAGLELPMTMQRLGGNAIFLSLFMAGHTAIFRECRGFRLYFWESTTWFAQTLLILFVNGIQYPELPLIPVLHAFTVNALCFVYVVVLTSPILFRRYNVDTSRNRLFRFLAATSTAKTPSIEGYDPRVEPESKILVGRHAITRTALRPSGSIRCEGVLLDAMSEGEFIEKDTEVLIIRSQGGRFIVRTLPSKPEEKEMR